MKILGINSVYHETAAALIVDGTVRCAVEEERFNRYISNPPFEPTPPGMDYFYPSYEKGPKQLQVQPSRKGYEHYWDVPVKSVALQFQQGESVDG